MFDVPTIRVGRVFGIPIEINLSWLVIFGLVAFSLGSAYFPQIPQAREAPALMHYLVGAVTALLFFASILAHELSHSLVTKAEGGDVEKITLFIFGGVAQIEEEPRSAGREFLMAAAGPGMSLLLSAVAFGGFVVTVGLRAPWWVWAPLEYLAAINLAVSIFNLLPGFPLDGGRVLRSVLWAISGDMAKATRWSSRSGQFIGWTMVLIAVIGVVNGRTDLIWFGLVGWFIASLAGQAYRQQVLHTRLDAVHVRDIMSPSPEYVQGDQTLERFVADHVLGSRHSRYPVMHEGSIVGVATLPDVKSVDRADWPFVRVLDITNRDLDRLVIRVDDLVGGLIDRLAADKPGALLVVEGGRMVGIVTRADVLHYLQAERG